MLLRAPSGVLSKYKCNNIIQNYIIKVSYKRLKCTTTFFSQGSFYAFSPDLDTNHKRNIPTLIKWFSAGIFNGEEEGGESRAGAADGLWCHQRAAETSAQRFRG